MFSILLSKRKVKPIPIHKQEHLEYDLNKIFSNYRDNYKRQNAVELNRDKIVKSSSR